MTSKAVRPQVLRRSKIPAEGSSFCSYGNRVCMQMRIEGYEYCARHILEDKNCPFKQCQYVSDKTAKRCTNAVLRMDKRDGYCTEHARQAAVRKYQATRKRKPKESPESLLEELEHYNPKSSAGSGIEQKKSRPGEMTASKVIEYLSSSDSEAEPLTVEQTWFGDEDSDAESVDSEQEDPLKHAGVYTAEEVALITRDKLIRLQSLYIDQFKWLQHEMKEKRRRYLHTICREREALGGIRYAKNDPEQRHKYEELVAMKRYHKRFGQEALLHRQSKERRIAVSEGINYRPPSYPKCIHSRNGGKCGARTVPLSKYCLEHILSDVHQVLFKPCNYANQCQRPVIMTTNSTACAYHVQPTVMEYRLPTKEEKDDSKIEIDVVGDTKHEEAHQSLQLQLQLQKQVQLDPSVSKGRGESVGRMTSHVRIVAPKILKTTQTSSLGQSMLPQIQTEPSKPAAENPSGISVERPQEKPLGSVQQASPSQKPPCPGASKQMEGTAHEKNLGSPAGKSHIVEHTTKSETTPLTVTATTATVPKPRPTGNLGSQISSVPQVVSDLLEREDRIKNRGTALPESSKSVDKEMKVLQSVETDRKDKDTGRSDHLVKDPKTSASDT